MALLACQGIALGYEGKKIIEHLSFSVDPGDYLCIVGENGSGKSTLIKTLTKLIPPIEGQITTGNGLSANEIGYLPQQSEVQKDFPASVREVVLSGCLNHCGLRPFYRRQEKKLASENMEKLGIANLSKRCYRELSGGQQQRVLLARALCATRKLLLLDEPTAGLDPGAAADMYQTIAKLNAQDQVTIIMISHDVASAVQYASHILHLGGHKPLFYGTAEEYTASDIGKIFSRGTGGEQS